MKACPIDLNPCCDDICHGSGCLNSEGEDMVELCHVCHKPINYELAYECCECEDEIDAENSDDT